LYKEGRFLFVVNFSRGLTTIDYKLVFQSILLCLFLSQIDALFDVPILLILVKLPITAFVLELNGRQPLSDKMSG